MNPSDLEKVSARLPLSKATLARNTDSDAGCSGVDKPGVTTTPARVRQSQKPIVNQLESDFWHYLHGTCSGAVNIRPKGKTYRLANGVRYEPDFTGKVYGYETCWEVKGPKAWDDAMVKIKVAAHEWPDIDWFLCWKQDGIWQIQKILP